MSDETTAVRQAEILRGGMNLMVEAGQAAQNMPGMGARMAGGLARLSDAAKSVSGATGRLTGFIAPKDNENADALSRELVQVGRASHVASTIGATTDAIIRCTAVWGDKNSSDTAKAAAVMRCVATAGQVAALFGPVGLIVSSVVGMISAIMESTASQGESMIDQLETLMRQLQGETTAAEINGAIRLLERQIAALDACPDQSLTWEGVLHQAPLTSGVSQFKILVASEWLYRDANQANPVWEDVLVCHVQAMFTVIRLLKLCQVKLSNPNDPVFLSVQKVIYNDFRDQCVRFGRRVGRMGNFWHTGIDDHYVYSSRDLARGWNKATDWGRFMAITARQDEGEPKVSGWGAYNDQTISAGTFDNDMKILHQAIGCTDIVIAPFQVGQSAQTLLVTVRGAAGGQPGRLVVHDVKDRAAPLAGMDAATFDWKSAHVIDRDSCDLQTARPFKTALPLTSGELTAMPVPAKCMYLLARHQDGFYWLGYARLDRLPAGGGTIATLQPIMVQSNRIAVSENYVFFVGDDLTTVHYCTHSEFIDPARANRTEFAKKSFGVLPLKPNVGGHAAQGLRDIFACADDHLLVVLASGEIWNVTLHLGAKGPRNLKEDQWDWFKVDGGADRVTMTGSDTVRILESLRIATAA